MSQTNVLTNFPLKKVLSLLGLNPHQLNSVPLHEMVYSVERVNISHGSALQISIKVFSMLSNNIMANTLSDFLHMVESVAETEKSKARMRQIEKGQSTIRKGAKHKSRRAKQRSEKK